MKKCLHIVLGSLEFAGLVMKYSYHPPFFCYKDQVADPGFQSGDKHNDEVRVQELCEERILIGNDHERGRG